MARRTPTSSAPPAEQAGPDQAGKATAKRRSKRGLPKPFLMEAEAGDTSLAGQVLIAMPAMADPRFSQGVILVCAHTPEGAIGIVLNRPAAKPSFTELLEQLEVGPIPPARSIGMCVGGPVDSARGFVLHSTDWIGEGSMRVDTTTALTASLDVLKAIAAGSGPADCVLALGYAGWAAGQLDQEIKQNVWLTATPDRNLLFDTNHTTKWHRAMASLNIDPILLSSTAGLA